ncbi:beta-glucosidase [Ramlibacter solisilvae]
MPLPTLAQTTPSRSDPATQRSVTDSRDPDRRAAETEAQMSDDERFQLLHGRLAIPWPGLPSPPAHWKISSGRVPGIPRLDIPDLAETDASLGIINPFGLREGDVATALPAGQALAATFNAKLAHDSGVMLGAEARAKGFNVLLGGGLNLARDFYCGRNFEYLGEDPLLAGVLAGESVRGSQSQGVIATVKHYSLNVQETLRDTLDARIDETAHRESDLLAFQIAIERGQPGAVMGAYNRINGEHASSNAHLLTSVLKQDWGYPGWVMSDWGAVHSVESFNAGLDQQSGATLDRQIWFDGPLREELAAGRVSRARLSDAVRRILRSVYAAGADRPLEESAIDYVAHAQVARAIAAQGMVLLKNDGVLPLSDAGAGPVLVVGGQAHIGVLAGYGSSMVTPVCGVAASIPVGAPSGFGQRSRQVYFASSPMEALRNALPHRQFSYDSGYFPQTTAARAAHASLVIVFATQWQGESMDADSLTLPQGQDALIAAIAQANPNTLVVLQTGNPVRMPWLKQVRAVLQAWYPGQEGGAAIADVLSGRVNPSGRLPVTFPLAESQAPRARAPGLGAPDGKSLTVNYFEGSDVGYRWYAKHGLRPLFAFGHGLSYTHFKHLGLKLALEGNTLVARFEVENIGERLGADVPQLYLVEAAGQPVRRLVGFERVELQPGERRAVQMTIDVRLLARWEGEGWSQHAGRYRFALGRSALKIGRRVGIVLPQRTLPP